MHRYALRYRLRLQRGPAQQQGENDNACPKKRHSRQLRTEATYTGDDGIMVFRCDDNMASMAGTNTRLPIRVQVRLSSNNTPMLAVPGWPDSASEPNAVAVVNAENTTALAVGEARCDRSPARQFMTK